MEIIIFGLLFAGVLYLCITSIIIAFIFIILIRTFIVQVKKSKLLTTGIFLTIFVCSFGILYMIKFAIPTKNIEDKVSQIPQNELIDIFNANSGSFDTMIDVINER